MCLFQKNVERRVFFEFEILVYNKLCVHLHDFFDGYENKDIIPHVFYSFVDFL